MKLTFIICIVLLPYFAGPWSPARADATPAPPVVLGRTPTRDTTPTWSWKSGGGGNGVFKYRLDSGHWTKTTARAFTPAADLAPGRHVLLVRERNAAGNWSIPGRKSIDIAPGIWIHVSPKGSDAAPGTLAAPVATLERARDLIRDLKAAGPLTRPITVLLRGGTYRLEKPLVLEAQDSGTPDAPIRYQSFQNERPVISGGLPIKGPWQAFTPDIFVTNVGTRRFNSLFVDGKRAMRAREPDADDRFRIIASSGVHTASIRSHPFGPINAMTASNSGPEMCRRAGATFRTSRWFRWRAGSSLAFD